MSSLVQAKCTNSFACARLASAPIFSLMKYSTAFTSWLVVASIALIRSPSATLKSSAMAFRVATWAASNGGSSVIFGSAASASSHSISTCTRRCIRPNSLKIGRSASTLPA